MGYVGNEIQNLGGRMMRLIFHQALIAPISFHCRKEGKSACGHTDAPVGPQSAKQKNPGILLLLFRLSTTLRGDGVRSFAEKQQRVGFGGSTLDIAKLSASESWVAVAMQLSGNIRWQSFATLQKSRPL